MQDIWNDQGVGSDVPHCAVEDWEHAFDQAMALTTLRFRMERQGCSDEGGDIVLEEWTPGVTQ